MEIVTTLSRQWRNRILFQAVFFIGFGFWFFYDGWIGYPRHNARLAEFAAAKARGEAAAWRTFAEQKGWTGQEHPDPYTTADLRVQPVLGAICEAAGALALAWFLISRRQKLTFDGRTVCGVRGQRVALEAFVEVDKRKWDRKGIAYAFYEEAGRRRRLTIDDYKFAGGEEILKHIEERLAARPR